MNNDDLKQKIRARYKGVNPDEIQLIAAMEEVDFYNDSTEKRVAVYARVSTDDPRQTSSYELQKNHYNDYVNQQANWTLVDIYADEGISGTSLKHRDAFNRMISDCKAGKIDLIVTKSVSRFARNLVDCVAYVRQLKEIDVGVFFETEGIYTLSSQSELFLSIIATLAQQESQNRHDSMERSIEMRFSRGIFLTPPLLGYDLDDTGDLVINEEEAKTVRLIFFSFLYGYSCKQIADLLNSLHTYTKKGNSKWSSGSIYGILQNERYCGDILSRKTYTVDFLEHKTRKNTGQRNQYRQADHHDCIVSRDDFLAVQSIIRITKTRSPGYLPRLNVIRNGVLRGFVVVHPKWLFHEDDYINASKSVYPDNTENTNYDRSVVEVNKGDADLRGFEIARKQFFNSTESAFISITSKSITANKRCINKLGDTSCIELLIHPIKKQLVLRKCQPDSKNAIFWATNKDNRIEPKEICGAPFLDAVYKIMEWDPAYRYRVSGVRRSDPSDSVMLFDLKETEVYIPSAADDKPSHRTFLVAYPISWANGFGTDYYLHAKRERSYERLPDSIPDLSISGEPVIPDNEIDLEMTSRDTLLNNISSLIKELEQERQA